MVPAVSQIVIFVGLLPTEGVLQQTEAIVVEVVDHD